MSNDPFEDDEELFALGFTEAEKRPMKVVLMLYTLIVLQDDEHPENIKNFIGQAGNIIAKAIEDALPGEEISLPYDGVVLVYYALAASANIMLTPNVKDGLTMVLKMNKMKAGPDDVELFYSQTKVMSQRKMDYIKHKHGHVSKIKPFITKAEKTWLHVAANRFQN